MSLPSKIKAIKVVGKGQAEIQEVPLPKLRDDYILIKTKFVAVNPTDWKHIDYLAEPGLTVGCDYSGTVEEVGSKVTKPFKKGDRIAGFTHGCNSVQPEDGCFAEYIVAKGDPQIKTPDSLTDEEAATLGVAIATVGQGLYESLKLPLPGSTKAGYPLLIYGGSSATGSIAIQYAVLSGCEVITTCSAHNFDFVKSLGASAVFDYKDPDCAQKIREHTKDALTKAFDCISDATSAKICSEAISSKGGAVSYLGQAKHDREDVSNTFTLAYTVVGEAFKLGAMEIPAKPEDAQFAKEFFELSTKLLAEKKIAVHPPTVGKEGLKGALEGIKLLRENKVSGTKLVYRVADTP